MSSDIAKGKSEGEGTLTFNNTKRVQRSIEGAKQLFQKEWRTSIYSGAIKIKYKKLLPRLLTQQTSADATVRFTNVKEDRDMLKIVSRGKLLERGLWIMTNTTSLPKDETVRCLKFEIKNVNTKY